MTAQHHTALLIDAKSTPVHKLATYLEKWRPADREITLKRAYGNWGDPGLKDWEPLLRTHAICPVQLFDCAGGSPAADIALAADAMELLHTGRYDTFILVSGQSDYTPLAMKLREAGVRIIGIGSADGSQVYRSACTHFICFHNLYTEDPDSLQALLSRCNFDEEEPSGLSDVPDGDLDTSFLFDGEDDPSGEQAAPAAGDGFSGAEARSLPAPGTEEEVAWIGDEEFAELELALAAFAAEALEEEDDEAAIAWDAPEEVFCSAAPAGNACGGMRGVHKLLAIAYDRCKDEQGYALLSSAGSFMRELRPELNYRDYGFKGLHELLRAYPDRYQVVRCPGKGLAFRCCV